MAIVYHIVFIGGPCNGRTGTITTPGNPPSQVMCRGGQYTLAPAYSAQRAAYTYTGTPPAPSDRAVRGQRDVFAAWGRLMRAFRHGTEKEVAALGRARRRVRRAVR